MPGGIFKPAGFCRRLTQPAKPALKGPAGNGVLFRRQARSPIQIYTALSVSPRAPLIPRQNWQSDAEQAHRRLETAAE